MVTAYRGPYIRLVATTVPIPVPIRPAATIVLVHDGEDGVEVLMVRRNRKAVFMSGAHVFPGGAVDEIDGSHLARDAVAWSGDPEEFSWRAAALRELFEEAGVLVGPRSDFDQALAGADLYEALVASGELLDADALEYVANWVTPLGPPRRFDTRFFVAAASGDPVTDDREVFDAVWVRPGAALEAAERGEWQLEFPTRSTLETFLGHATTAELMLAAAAIDVERIAPRIATAEDGTIKILLPGDPGFGEAMA
ncbi:MAG: NUDIX domain-containing protein [Acidimicrobiia bacterium]